TIVDKLKRQLAYQGLSGSTDKPIILSYFFCQGTDENLKNATAVLRGLIYILDVKCLSFVSHLCRKYDIARSKLFEGPNVFDTLSEVLEHMLRDASLLRVYIVIDALDECRRDL